MTMSSSESSDEPAEVFTRKSDSDAPFSKLGDDLLQRIFSFVPVFEWLELEKVCRQWKRAVRSLWRAQERVDLANNIPCKFEKKHRNLQFLKQIFKRACLKRLNLKGGRISKSDGLAEVIVSKCPELKELCLANVRLTGYKLHMLARLKDLKILVLHDCGSIKDSALKFALKDNLSLTHLEVTCSDRLRGNFLKSVKAPLESLNLYSNKKLSPSNFHKSLDQFGPTLKHLNLSACPRLSVDRDIPVIAERLPNLQSLTIVELKHQSDSKELRQISKLKNLETLNLSYNINVTTSYLKFLVKECQPLKSLDISGTDGNDGNTYEDLTIACLSGLQNLRALNLSFLTGLYNEDIRKYASNSPPIEYLFINGLEELEDSDVKVILHKCHQLKYLDISDCESITKRTVKAANQALEKRSDNRPLCLVVEGTRIKRQKATGNDSQTANAPNHPLLTVKYKSDSDVKCELFLPAWKRYSFFDCDSNNDGFFDFDDSGSGSDSSFGSDGYDDDLSPLERIANMAENVNRDEEWKPRRRRLLGESSSEESEEKSAAETSFTESSDDENDDLD